MKTITIKQPWASLIIDGAKDIENRSWQTKFRGRVLVHAAAKNAGNYFDLLNANQKNYYMGYRVKKGYSPIKDLFLNNGCIIGSIEIVDCVINHESVWADKSEGVIAGNTFYHKEKDKLIWNWVLANPIKFPEPIATKGKLSFWDYPNILAEPEKKDGELFCH
jgi:hypothetical protein